ncbi:MAG: CcmD family protein [Chloroflexota bacterium]
MMENFWYLFAAYTVILVVLFIYVFRIFVAQRKVQDELDTLKRARK